MSRGFPDGQVRDYQDERAELADVLASGTFTRAKLLRRFLVYICNKHFAGEDDQIKEYNIAVEALGRPAVFDHTRDSIVRVEAYRLRKRLSDYYQGPGAGHPLHITIPSGSYVPVFEQRPAAAAGLSGPEPGALDSVRQRGLGGWIAAAAAIAAVAALWSVGRAPEEAIARNSSLAVAYESAAGDDDTAFARISAGMTGATYVDEFGRAWESDRYFTGGEVVQTSEVHIERAGAPQLFQSYREGDFRYDIPLDPGVYQLQLYFAETFYGPGNPGAGSETSRLFDVTCNGRKLLADFDVLADAGGPNTGNVRVFKDISPAADGRLHLAFSGVAGKALLNAVEILPGIPGSLRPIRSLAGRSAYHHDGAGRRWGADRFYQGGSAVIRPIRVKGTTEGNLFGGERYGHFSYSFPVDDGSYRLTLRFAETWFGPTNPGGGGEGDRVFDVYCNGVALLTGFDVFKEAGGENRALERIFRHIAPNAQGKINLTFVPVRNYGLINAIELVDEKLDGESAHIAADTALSKSGLY